MKPEILRLSRVTQAEGKDIVLHDIDMYIMHGEILGLVYRNTIGLDALLALIQTNIPVYYGRVWFSEALTNTYLHSSLLPNKVALIGPKPMLLENLSVADNIFVMRPGFGMRLIRERRMERQTTILFEEAGVDIPVDAKTARLSVFNRCVVELLRAKVSGAKLIILLDLSNVMRTEPMKRYHTLVRRMARDGMSFLYVCSNADEAAVIADRISIMENGRIVRVMSQWQQQRDSTGSGAKAFAKPEKTGAFLSEGPPALELRGVTMEHLANLSLVVRAGELVILRNVSYRANANLLALLTGQVTPQCGEVIIDGAVVVIPEDPIGNALFMNLSFMDNLCFLAEIRGELSRKDAAVECAAVFGEYLQTRDITSLPSSVLYDLVYYRASLARPRVVFVIKPFAEPDRQLRDRVAALICKLQRQGIAVLITELSGKSGGECPNHVGAR